MEQKWFDMHCDQQKGRKAGPVLFLRTACNISSLASPVENPQRGHIALY